MVNLLSVASKVRDGRMSPCTTCKLTAEGAVCDRRARGGENFWLVWEKGRYWRDLRVGVESWDVIALSFVPVAACSVAGKGGNGRRGVSTAVVKGLGVRSVVGGVEVLAVAVSVVSVEGAGGIDEAGIIVVGFVAVVAAVGSGISVEGAGDVDEASRRAPLRSGPRLRYC